MALYTAIGSQFKASLMKEFDSLLDERIKSVITQTLKQVAHDYDLDYKALKNRYCSKESLVEYVTVDLNEARHEARHEAETQIVDHDEYAFEPEPEPKVTVPKAKVTASKPAMALSKMKKAELVEECEVRGLDSEGTVSQLRERLKDSRDPEPVKTKKKASPKKKVAEGDPDPVKKKASPRKKKVEGDPVKKKKVAPVPAPVPPPHVALEEEDEDEDDDGVHVKPALEEEDEDDEDVCRRVPVDGDGDEFEVEDDDSGFEKKLRAILLEAGELEEEEEELD